MMLRHGLLLFNDVVSPLAFEIFTEEVDRW
jgi:hypothetical protein